MSEASQWTELLLRKQQMDATAQANQNAAWRDSVEKLGQAGGRLAAGLTDQDLLKAMGQWKLQGIIDKLRREQAQQAEGARQGTATGQPQPSFRPSGQGAMPAQSGPQPRPSPGPAVSTAPPPQKVSYAPGMVIRNPETGERLQWGGSEWMRA